jgi:alkylresorcinol/alkylpyrone synthase
MSSIAPVIQSVSRTLPEHYWPQDALLKHFRKLWATKFFNVERMERIFDRVQVGGRYLGVPPDELERLDSFGKRNDAYIRVATELGAKAIQEALKGTDLTPKDIDHIFFVSITGLATPSIDVLVANRLGMRKDVKRTPVFGWGCAGGASGLARAADSLRGFEDQVTVLLCVELCLVTHQTQDVSVANIIASGLFGDAASAAVLTGGKRKGTRPGPKVLASRACLYPNTEHILGWDIVDTGFKIVLSPQIPVMVKEHFGPDVDAFLATQGLDRSRIKHWLLHTGGPEVLKSTQATLGLSHDATARTWESLKKFGNLSSASVLFVLADLMESGEAKPGDYGLMAAMGPGFACELVLLQW